MSYTPPTLEVISVSAATAMVERAAYIADTSGAAFALTLPLAASAGEGEEIEVIDAGSAGTNNLTVTRSGSDTIETQGAAAQTSIVISTDRRALRFRSDGVSAWYLLGDTNDTAGEANTASNVGAGEGVFKQKAGVDLEFKSFTGGSNVSVAASGADEIDVKYAGDVDPQTSNVTTSTGKVVKCDSSGGGFTVTLPTAAGITGETITVKDGNGSSSGANRVTIDFDGAETADGKTSIKLTKNAALVFQSDGTNWMIV